MIYKTPSKTGRIRIIQMYIKVHIKVGNQLEVGEGFKITAINIIKKRATHIYRRNLAIFPNLIM